MFVTMGVCESMGVCMLVNVGLAMTSVLPGSQQLAGGRPLRPFLVTVSRVQPCQLQGPRLRVDTASESWEFPGQESDRPR